MNESQASTVPARPRPRLSHARWRNVGAMLAGLVLVMGLMIGMNVELSRELGISTAAFLAITLLLAWAIHGAGGLLCAVLSRDNVYAVSGLIVLGTAVMLWSITQTWTTVPPWYSMIMAVAAPGGLWIGARLHRRRALAVQ